MVIFIEESSANASGKAAEIVINLLKSKPNAVLGLATGGTPVRLYGELIDANSRGEISFKSVETFNLDEYLGIPAADANSYRSFMDKNFFDRIDIDKSKTHVLDGMASDVAAVCKSFEKSIEHAGGIDLQILGLGADGHIGFNEPGSSFTSRTHVEFLAQKTIDDNARFFGGDRSKVPERAITMGIATIMSAKKILLLAFGDKKSDAVKAMVEGEINESVPASILRNHPDATIFLDKAAASKLDRRNPNIFDCTAR